MNFALTSNLNLLYFILERFPLVLSLSAQVKSHSPSFSISPFKYQVKALTDFAHSVPAASQMAL